jgi:perosamine synthetase
MYSILVQDEFGCSRDDLATKLRESGIETRPFFIPMHQQPVFQNKGSGAGERYPIADGLGQRGLYLPSGSGLTEEEIRFVCQTVKEIRETN